MPGKTPSVIASILTIILLLLVAVVTMFMQIILLNGVVNDRQATTALGITFGCQGVELILGVIFTRWLTHRLIEHHHWNITLSVIVAVTLAIVSGAVLSSLSIFAGLIAAGI